MQNQPQAGLWAPKLAFISDGGIVGVSNEELPIGPTWPERRRFVQSCSHCALAALHRRNGKKLMDGTLQIRSSVEQKIRSAFRGVTLGAGTSLRRAQLVDAPSREYVESSTQREIVGDWSQVPLDELERDCVAHLDALGFRYYIPALMLSVLDHYDSSSMRVIGTLTVLYPKKDNTWEYHMHRYSLLDATQKAAIAQFLAELPKLVELDSESQKTVERALRNYWGEYFQ
jgi:hypothetical protein